MNRFFRRLILPLLLALPLPALAAPATGYWWNPAAGGSGFVIEVQGNNMFMAGFLYAASGEATWVASTGPMTSTTQYSGSLITFTGGQTLTGSYATPQQSAPLGNIAITFSDDSHASMTWPGGTVPITRYDFGPGGSENPQPASTPQTGWWWCQNEGGRGFGLEIQGGILYFAGYMYDASGNPVWYLSSGTMTNPTLYQGTWQQFAGGQTLTGPYRAPTTANANAGNVTIQFESPGQATLTLPDGRQIPFVRYTFGLTGPTLSSFNTAAAAAAAPLVISGSGIDTTAALSLTFYDNTGYRAVVPLSAASATRIQAGVPPYVNVATGAFGSGPVYVKLTQTSLGVSVDSNTLSGFTIQPMPMVPSTIGPPGTLTLATLRAELAETQRLKTVVSSSAIGTGALVTAIGQQITDLQALTNNVQTVVQGGSFSLGSVGGVNLTVTPANIGDGDAQILSLLNNLPAESSAGPSCGQAQATTAVSDINAGAGGVVIQQDILNLIEAFGSSPACGTVPAITMAYDTVSGAANTSLGLVNDAGAGSSELVLPGQALTTLTLAELSRNFELEVQIGPALKGQAPAIESLITGGANLVATNIGALTLAASDPYLAYMVDFFTTQYSTSYTGYLFAAWHGVCGGKNVSGIMEMDIDPDGLDGFFSGDVSGDISGFVDMSGKLTASSPTPFPGNFVWSGNLVLTTTPANKFGDKFIGSTGKFTDNLTCDGVWTVL